MSDDQEYEHWPDDHTQRAQTAVAARGYDNHNGLHRHIYQPAVPEPAVLPTQPYQVFYPQQVVPYGYPQYLAAPQAQAPQPQVTCYWPPAVLPAPAPVPAPAPAQPTYYTYAQPAIAPPTFVQMGGALSTPRANAREPDSLWVGRTKAQVDEDNMQMAAEQGAYDKRKVEPVGVADDQIFWVVEPDGYNLLRTFADIKEMKGEWKLDPRFTESYYFVREQEKKSK